MLGQCGTQGHSPLDQEPPAGLCKQNLWMVLLPKLSVQTQKSRQAAGGIPWDNTELWKPHKNAFPTHNFTHLQRFSSSMTIFDFVKYFWALSSWNCQPGLFSRGFMEELVISGGLAALGALEPVLGVQGRGRCDSQHGRQGNHFPKKSKVSSVSANPSPWGHSRGTGRSGLRNNHGLPWNNNTTNPGTPLVATSCPAPAGFRGISTCQGGGRNPGSSKQGVRLPDPTWIAGGAGNWTWDEGRLTLTQTQGEVQLPSAKLGSWGLLRAALPLWQKVGIHLPGWIHLPALLLLCLSCCVRVPVC